MHPGPAPHRSCLKPPAHQAAPSRPPALTSQTQGTVPGRLVTHQRPRVPLHLHQAPKAGPRQGCSHPQHIPRPAGETDRRPSSSTGQSDVQDGSRWGGEACQQEELARPRPGGEEAGKASDQQHRGCVSAEGSGAGRWKLRVSEPLVGLQSRTVPGSTTHRSPCELGPDRETERALLGSTRGLGLGAEPA